MDFLEEAKENYKNITSCFSVSSPPDSKDYAFLSIAAVLIDIAEKLEKIKNHTSYLSYLGLEK